MSTLPTAVAKLTLPPVPSLTVTRFGIVSPAAKLRLDALGCAAPVGHTVTKLPVVDAVAVTFITTADAVGGTLDAPPSPGTSRSFGVPADNLAFQSPIRVRESRIRKGGSGW